MFRAQVSQVEMEGRQFDPGVWNPKERLPLSLYLGMSLDCLPIGFLFPGKVGEESEPILQLHCLVDVEMFLLSSRETQNPVQRLLIHS